MTQPLPSLSVPAASSQPVRPDGPQPDAGDGFDGTLREQMSSAPAVAEPAAEPAQPAGGTDPAGGAGDAAAADPAAGDRAAAAELAAQTPLAGGAAGAPARPAAGAGGAAPAGLEPPPERPGGALPAGAPAAEEAALLPVMPQAPGRAPTRPADPVAAGKAAAGAGRQGAAPGAARAGEVLARAVAQGARGTEPVVPGAEDASGEATATPRSGPATHGAQGAGPFAAALHAASAAAPRAAALPPVMVPVADPEWGAALGSRLAIGVANGVQSASIALNPQDLGPLQLTLTVHEDEASVTFVSNHAAVRDAIESALPRLREMLADEGITLADVDVWSGGERPGERREDAPRGPRGEGAGDEPPAASADAQPVLRGRDSLVDTFA